MIQIFPRMGSALFGGLDPTLIETVYIFSVIENIGKERDKHTQEYGSLVETLKKKLKVATKTLLSKQKLQQQLRQYITFWGNV